MKYMNAVHSLMLQSIEGIYVKTHQIKWCSLMEGSEKHGIRKGGH